MIIRLIELPKEETLYSIPASDGVIFYCTDTMSAWLDNSNSRTKIDFIIKVDTLPTTGLDDKVYFLSTNSKLYRYDYEWYEANSLEDFFDIIVKNEEAVGCYLKQNGKVITPITSSELVIRPSGEDIEDSMLKAETEIRNNLNAYYRYTSAVSDNQTEFVIPLPYERYLIDGNTFTLFVNKTKVELSTDYTIDYDNGKLTLNTAVMKASLLEFIFYYNADRMNVRQEIIISKDKVRAYNLTKYTYLPGANRLSIYINGIKQPKEAFTETSKSSFTLNGDIPKDSIIMAEIGYVEDNSTTFFDYFRENKTVTKTANNITIVYDSDPFGRTKKIVQDLDSEGRVIKETAYLNNVQVAVRNINYNDALGITTYTHNIL